MDRELVKYYDERIATAKTWERHPLNTRALWKFRLYRFEARWGRVIAALVGSLTGVLIGAGIALVIL